MPCQVYRKRFLWGNERGFFVLPEIIWIKSANSEHFTRCFAHSYTTFPYHSFWVFFAKGGRLLFRKFFSPLCAEISCRLLLPFVGKGRNNPSTIAAIHGSHDWKIRRVVEYKQECCNEACFLNVSTMITVTQTDTLICMTYTSLISVAFALPFTSLISPAYLFVELKRAELT